MDIVSPLTFAELSLRLVVAVLLGAAVGFDRELQNKPAGFRTHAMVALGSALMCVMSLGFEGPKTLDTEMVSRVLQGIIAGIGFVGGGAILRRGSSEQDVSGLTTATSIWVVAAIGAAAGLGLWQAALLASLLSLIILTGGGLVTSLSARWKKRQSGLPPTGG